MQDASEVDSYICSFSGLFGYENAHVYHIRLQDSNHRHRRSGLTSSGLSKLYVRAWSASFVILDIITTHFIRLFVCRSG